MSKDIKKALLGAVIKDSGPHEPDISILELPLSSTNCVIRGFCSNCGEYAEYTKKALSMLSPSDGEKDVPTEYDNTYLLTSSCGLCYDDETKPSIKVGFVPIK